MWLAPPRLLQTPRVSAAVVARVFLDPQLRCGHREAFESVGGLFCCLLALPAGRRCCSCPLPLPALPPDPSAHLRGQHHQAVSILSKAATGRGAYHVCLPQALRRLLLHRGTHPCHCAHRQGRGREAGLRWRGLQPERQAVYCRQCRQLTQVAATRGYRVPFPSRPFISPLSSTCCTRQAFEWSVWSGALAA